MHQVVPVAPWVLAACPWEHRSPAVLFVSSCPGAWILPPPAPPPLCLLYTLYLWPLIQATSWSGAGPDLICCQREACLWADGPLWSRSSSSSSYKLASFTCCLYMGPAASRSLFSRRLSSFNCCLFNLVVALTSQHWFQSECCRLVF